MLTFNALVLDLEVVTIMRAARYRRPTHSQHTLRLPHTSLLNPCGLYERIGRARSLPGDVTRALHADVIAVLGVEDVDDAAVGARQVEFGLLVLAEADDS